METEKLSSILLSKEYEEKYSRQRRRQKSTPDRRSLVHSKKRKEDNIAGEQWIHFRLQPYFAARGNHTSRLCLAPLKWEQPDGEIRQVSARFHALIWPKITHFILTGLLKYIPIVTDFCCCLFLPPKSLSNSLENMLSLGYRRNLQIKAWVAILDKFYIRN